MMNAMLLPDSGWIWNERGFARPLIAGINPSDEFDNRKPGTDANGNPIINQCTTSSLETGLWCSAGLEYHLNDKVEPGFLRSSTHAINNKKPLSVQRRHATVV